jgi:[ribosomal protein S5]-alanine N-acetyltransferase
MLIAETERLRLREYKAEDEAQLRTILTNEATMAFWPKPLTEEQVRQWLEQSMRDYREYGVGRWAVQDKESGRLIGDCGFKRVELDGRPEWDLGYIIHYPDWRRGFGFEAAQASLEYGWRQSLSRVCVNMPFNHHGSRQIAEKLGMTKEKEFINKRNRDILTFLYALERP